MSLKDTKEQLIQLLTDDDNKVIALSGKWGTGKSFMWEQVKTASNNDKVNSALYASLFGTSSIDQIKFKLIQSTTKSIEDYPALWKSVTQGLSSGIKVLEGVHRSFGALSDLALLVAPAILRQKFIVLDDIERKHDKLSIDEILGFIDEITKQHGSRVLLILNSDQLDHQDSWNTLREKVIDQELKITTTASEAFTIGKDLVPSNWVGHIQPSIELCGVVNIRIVCKIIKAVNRILSNCTEIKPAVLARVIPPTVLLSAIHYKGIENGPDLDFVLAQGSPPDISDYFDDTKDAEIHVEKYKSTWKILLNQLGIYSCDEFELLVIEFLQSGLFDIKKLKAVIKRYIDEADEMEVRTECNRFLMEAIWDHHLTESELLEKAELVVQKVHYLNPYMVTTFHDTLTNIQGGQILAEKAVSHWISAFRMKPVHLQEIVTENLFGRKVHSRIEAEFKTIAAKSQANTSVLDACKSIVEKHSWGLREGGVMKTAMVEDFEMTIRNATINDLQLFMSGMLDLCKNKDTYLGHFGPAMDNFVSACRNISEDVTHPRLARLVKLLFTNADLSKLLEPPS